MQTNFQNSEITELFAIPDICIHQAVHINYNTNWTCLPLSPFSSSKTLKKLQNSISMKNKNCLPKSSHSLLTNTIHQITIHTRQAMLTKHGPCPNKSWVVIPKERSLNYLAPEYKDNINKGDVKRKCPVRLHPLE